MRKIGKFFAIAFVSATILSISGMNVFAASATQDDLKVTLTTDKQEYSVSESIKTELTVTNNNSFSVDNVKLETKIPEGFALSDNSESKKTFDSIAAGESVSLNVSITKTSADSSSSGESTVSPVKGSTNSGATGTTGDTADNTDDGANINIADETSDEATINSGDASMQKAQTYILIGIAMLAAIAAMMTLVFVFRKKLSAGRSGKTMLSVFLCIGILGSFASVASVRADAKEPTDNIAVSETITVGGDQVTISAVVTVGTEEEKGLEKPENPSEVDEYYWFNSEKVLDVIPAAESKNVQSEKDVIAFLESKGFMDQDITYYYDMEGNLITETAASNSSSEKHPFYNSMYVAENGDIWLLYIVNGEIYADSLSYDDESGRGMRNIVSEANKVTNYSVEANSYYVTIPKSSAMIVKTVDTINSATLDKLTVEELKKL